MVGFIITSNWTPNQMCRACKFTYTPGNLMRGMKPFKSLHEIMVYIHPH